MNEMDQTHRLQLEAWPPRTKLDVCQQGRRRVASSGCATRQDLRVPRECQATGGKLEVRHEQWGMWRDREGQKLESGGPVLPRPRMPSWSLGVCGDLSRCQGENWGGHYSSGERPAVPLKQRFSHFEVCTDHPGLLKRSLWLSRSREGLRFHISSTLPG